MSSIAVAKLAARFTVAIGPRCCGNCGHAKRGNGIHCAANGFFVTTRNLCERYVSTADEAPTQPRTAGAAAV